MSCDMGHVGDCKHSPLHLRFESEGVLKIFSQRMSWSLSAVTKLFVGQPWLHHVCQILMYMSLNEYHTFVPQDFNVYYTHTHITW